MFIPALAQALELPDPGAHTSPEGLQDVGDLVAEHMDKGFFGPVDNLGQTNVPLVLPGPVGNGLSRDPELTRDLDWLYATGVELEGAKAPGEHSGTAGPSHRPNPPRPLSPVARSPQSTHHNHKYSTAAIVGTGWRC